VKKIELGQVLTVISNCAVVAGIVFLALELRQSQMVGRSQVRNEIAQAYLQLTQNDMNLSEDVLNAVQDIHGDSSTENDRLRATIWANAWLRLWENMYYQYSRHFFDEDEFRAATAALRNRLNADSPVIRRQLCGQRDVYSASFVAFAESLLVEPCP
jgi:hypothetical protein